MTRGIVEVPVSVVIPFYNGHRTIQRAVASIVLQAVRPAEVIIVDDGSEVPLTFDYVNVPGNIRILRHQRNRGIPAARNTGIRAASKEWIAFLDQDDEWADGKLARQWKAADSTSDAVDTVFYGRLVFSTGGSKPTKAKPYPPLSSIRRVQKGRQYAVWELITTGMVVPFVTLLLHRSIFDRHGLLDEEITGGSDDFEFVLRLAAEGTKFVNVDIKEGPRVYSAIHHYTGENYSNVVRSVRDHRLILEKLSKRYSIVAELSRVGLALMDYALGRHLQRTGQLTEAKRLYRSALAHRPVWWRPWIALALANMPFPVQKAAESAWLYLRRIM